MIIKIKKYLHIFRREIAIFALLFFTLLCTLPDNLHGWNSAWYAMDYSLGFDSRLFIGSILHLFYPDFLPAEAVYTFVLLSIILLLLVLSYILGYALRQTDNSPEGTGLIALIIFYLLCPASPSYLWNSENLGRFDLYLFLLILIAAILYLKAASVTIRLIGFTLTGLIALSIHQVFIFIFFPLLFTLGLATGTEEKAKKKHLTMTIIGWIIMGSGFLYFQLFSHINTASLEELTALLSSRTNLEINEVALNYEYFATITQSIQELVLNQLGERIRYGLVTLLLLAPLAVIYCYLWFQIIRTAEKKNRLKYLLFLSSHLCFIPAFILTIDWGRWFGAFLTVQALQIIILAAKKDAVVLSALSRLSTVLRKHPYLFIIIGIWLGSLHKFQATLLPDAPVFFASVYKVCRMVF